MSTDVNKIVIGPADISLSPRDVALTTVTALASPAPTTTSFSVSAADAAKFGFRKGSRLSTAATPAFTAAEAASAPVIQSVTLNGSNYDVVVSPAFGGGAPATTAGAIKILWSDLGATEGGASIDVTVETRDEKVDQEIDPVAVTTTGRELMLKAPLAENALDTVALGFGVAGPSSTGVLQIGSTANVRADRFLVVGPGPDGKKRYYVINKGVNKGTTNLRMSREGKAIVDLNVKGYLDTTMGNAALVDIKEA